LPSFGGLEDNGELLEGELHPHFLPVPLIQLPAIQRNFLTQTDILPYQVKRGTGGK